MALSDTTSYYLGGYEPTDSGRWARLGGTDRAELSPPTALTFWASLSESAQYWFLTNGRQHRVSNERHLLVQGNTPTVVMVLLTGVALSEIVTPQGEHHYVDLASSGDLLGVAEIISGNLYPATVRAIAPRNHVLIIPRAQFHQVLHRPEVMLALMHALTARLMHTHQLRAVVTGPAWRRIATILLYLADRIGAMSSVGPVIKTTQIDLARWTGLSLRTVENVLGALEHQGGIACARRKITITDVPSLRHLME